LASPDLHAHAKAPPPQTLPDDTESLGNEIARLAAHLNAATYHLLALIHEFDEREGWAGGFVSCAHWLSWRTGICQGPAREKVRVARALASLPLISKAMAQGQMSYSKVRALTRVASPDNEAELLGVARHATAVHIEKLVRAWRRVDRLEEAEEERQRHQSRFLRLYPDDDGNYVLRGRLDPEVGALLEKALEWASEALYRKETPEERTAELATSFDQRRADALGLLAEQAMAATGTELEEDQGSGGGDSTLESSRALGRADRFQVVLHVDVPGLGHGTVDADSIGDSVGDSASNPVSSAAGQAAGPAPGSASGHAVLADTGSGVPAGTSRRLACDATVVLMTHGENGRVLDVGRKRRTVPPAIRRALDHRDRGCRFPGCGLRYTDAHHITHWADGGETKLENLVLLCRRHHRAVHEEGFLVEAAESGRVLFFHPDGSPIPPVPEPPPVPAEPVTELMRTHSERGIAPDAWAATPLWTGETFDYSLAIDMLRSPNAAKLEEAPVRAPLSGDAPEAYPSNEEAALRGHHPLE
jgi:hypothetical protein